MKRLIIFIFIIIFLYFTYNKYNYEYFKNDKDDIKNIINKALEEVFGNTIKRFDNKNKRMININKEIKSIINSNLDKDHNNETIISSHNDHHKTSNINTFYLRQYDNLFNNKNININNINPYVIIMDNYDGKIIKNVPIEKIYKTNNHNLDHTYNNDYDEVFYYLNMKVKVSYNGELVNGTIININKNESDDSSDNTYDIHLNSGTPITLFNKYHKDNKIYKNDFVHSFRQTFFNPNSTNEKIYKKQYDFKINSDILTKLNNSIQYNTHIDVNSNSYKKLSKLDQETALRKKKNIEFRLKASKVVYDYFNCKDNNIYPVDCKVSDWTNKKCNTSCGTDNYVITNTRNIIKESKNGGNKCPTILTKTTNCNKTKDCECKLGEWETIDNSIGECPRKCGQLASNIIKVRDPIDSNQKNCPEKESSDRYKIINCQQTYGCIDPNDKIFDFKNKYTKKERIDAATEEIKIYNNNLFIFDLAVEFMGDKKCGGEYGGMIQEDPDEIYRTLYEFSKSDDYDKRKTAICIALNNLTNDNDILKNTGCKVTEKQCEEIGM